MTKNILTAIDGALADHITSKDAMRWAPPTEGDGKDDALLLTEAGDLTPVSLPDDPDGHLATFYKALGCHTVDAVELASILDMWVDDNGMGTRPVNRLATTIAAAFGHHHQNYYGPALFTGGIDDDGDTMPLMPGVAKAIREAVAAAVASLGS